MSDRDYERIERRRRTRRKEAVTSVIAGTVIVAAIAVIIVAVIAVVSRNNAPEAVQPTEAATEQPTLYQPTEQSPTATEAKTEYYQPTYSNTELPTSAVNTTPAYGEATTAAAQPGTQYSEQAVSGALHYYAYGMTTEGYYWTYSSYGTTVDITCVYDFQQHKYDFVITGTSPGTTSFTLYYKTDDDHELSETMTVSVDENLRVTQIG